MVPLATQALAVLLNEVARDLKEGLAQCQTAGPDTTQALHARIEAKIRGYYAILGSLKVYLTSEDFSEERRDRLLKVVRFFNPDPAVT